MSRFSEIRLGALLAATAVLAAACGSDGQDSAATVTSAAPSTVTMTATPTAPSTTTPPPPTTTVTVTSAPPATEASRSEAQRMSADELMEAFYGSPITVPSPGDRVTIDGQPAIIVLAGDGYGIGVVARSAATSAEFAGAVLTDLTRGLDSTTESLRATLPRTINVASPVTGRSYAMSCTSDERQLITCTGGQGAVVYMF